jgi:effector-binding domain-containing protein
LNFGAVMQRNVALIHAADAFPETVVILTEDNSLWGADVYIEVTGDIPGAKMATISGTFLSRVFEGSYRNVRQWIREMKNFVQSKGMTLRKRYIFYTTCPKCAKKYGKNYVVILAQI